jgi:hypothetical protein
MSASLDFLGGTSPNPATKENKKKRYPDPSRQSRVRVSEPLVYEVQQGVFFFKTFPKCNQKMSAAKITLKQRKKEVFVSPRSPKSCRKSSNHATDVLDSRISLASEILIVYSFKSPGNFSAFERSEEHTKMQREFPVLYKAASVSIATPIIGFAAIFYLQHGIAKPVV